MKLLGAFGFAGVLGVCAAGVAFGIGCSSSTVSGSDGGGGGGPGLGVPPQPSGGMTTATTAHNYALHTLYLGGTTRSGQPSDTAWKDFGYNLDGKASTRASTDVCTLVSGAPLSTQDDGTNGIDNSFGANILPIVMSTAGDINSTLNTSINKGSFTLMTYVKGFDDMNPTQTATGLTGALISGTDYSILDAGPPAWNTSTHWPVAPDLLTCGANCVKGTDDPIGKSKVQFPHAYVTNGTFVNGSPSDVQLSLGIGGQTLTVLTHSAVLTFDHSTPGSVKNGTIAGVIKTPELLDAVRGIAGHISRSLCGGAAFQSIANAITQASDIVYHDDTGAISNNAGETCNAISIGLGFDSTEIAVPTPADIAGPTPPAPDPCADAGAE
jgi:hypothetical protein